MRHDKYLIALGIDEKISSCTQEMKQKILSLLFEQYQGIFAPERYNYFEPVNKKFSNPTELLKNWNEPYFMLKRIKHPKMNFTFDSLFRENLHHKCYYLFVDIDCKIKSEIIESFFVDMIEMTHPFWAYISSDIHWLDRTLVKYEDTSSLSGKKMIYQHHICRPPSQRLYGIFWRTYLSKTLVDECQWTEKIKNVPCQHQCLSDGYLLKVYENCFDNDWDKEEQIINYLGREYIADIKTYYRENKLQPIDEQFHWK